jgi:tetratricopeptide (TPR) repeat protein
MGVSNDIQSQSTEPQEEQHATSGGFFKKYSVVTPNESGPSSDPIFKKYVPPGNGHGNDADQPSAGEFGPSVSGSAEPATRWSKGRVPVLVWWGVASVLVILAGWFIVNVVLNIQNRGRQQTDFNNQPSAGDASPDVGANVHPGETALGSLSSTLVDSSDDDEKEPSKSARSRRLAVSSTNSLYNVMMGRAREFEDRGMLSRAEEEYQAVAISFPGDTLSQAGLGRVQRVLSSRRETERSRVNRETGLRNFRMSDYARAERELSAAVNAGRVDTATLYALGMSYLKLGDYAKAERVLDRCIAETPDYTPALVGLAEASAATGRRDKALPLFQRALELGGGAEFTPAKITDMISNLEPERAAPSPSALSLPTPERSQPTFIARVVHSHDFLLASCKGDLEIVNSVVHYNGSNPGHSFHVLASEVIGAHIVGNALHFKVGGKPYRFTLKGRPARDFLDALAR